MIELTDTGADDVVGIRVDGKVTKADIESAIEAIDRTMAAHPKVSFIADVDGMSGISPAALLKDISYGIEQLTHSDKGRRPYRMFLPSGRRDSISAAWEEGLPRRLLIHPF